MIAAPYRQSEEHPVEELDWMLEAAPDEAARDTVTARLELLRSVGAEIG